MLLFNLSPPGDWAWAGYAASALVLWPVTVAVYRRYFHPLANVPGPFLPSVTRLYLWYHNIIKDGTYYKRIEEMHQKYGPIVRVAPNEIHLSDPEDYDVIYSVGSKFYKAASFYGALGVYVMFSVESNEDHRRLRAPMSHFFSRRAVFDLEALVQAKVRKLCRRMHEALDAGKPVDLRAGTRAISIDVMTEYAFDDCWDHLDDPDFCSWFSEAVRDTGVMWWTFQQFPALLKPMQAMPEDWARKMSPAMNGWMNCVVRAREYVMKVKEQFDAGLKPSRRTIFHEILDSEVADTVDYGVPTVEYLAGEALSFSTAAADTTGNAMEMAIYHVVTNPDIYERLRAELVEAFPDADQELSYATLEKLPYLTGVVKEGQRLSFGVIGRLARTTPEGGAVFHGHFIPAGTTVAMSSWMMHRNPDVYPNPDTFDPTRWLDPVQARAGEKCLVPFSKGSRMCIGQNLAMAEVYLTIGTLFRRFDNLVAYDVGPEDMTYVDYFTAFHPKGSRPFKVAARGQVN
ncbi:hypothetical protein jhhlp_004895 [Lomentospora prolificans]|uniref:Cytochrome P450 n=1 Tax=Lomentospora prolificans TaxID=41688 RepID=A0A2N3N7T9_9PEZI|nr:hypothetical protein jhhlp_004895 [Lomentospora prolificans]